MCRYLLFFTFLLGTLIAHSQEINAPSRRALKQFEEAQLQLSARDYDQAIEGLEKLSRKYPNFLEAWVLLAEAYHQDGQEKNAINAYANQVNQDSAFYTPSLYKLSKLLFESGRYEEGLKGIRSLLNRIDSKSRYYKDANLISNSCKFALKSIKNPVPFEPEKLMGNVNITGGEYVNAVTANDSLIYYTYRKEISKPGQRLDYTEYIRNAKLSDEDGMWYNYESFDKLFGGDVISGAMTINPKGDEIYFTACGLQYGIGSCDIYYMRKKEGVWSFPLNAGPMINSSSWDSQPSISPDGRVMYFSSKRKGGYGGADIWYSTKDSLGHWMPAKNLGATINTEGDEFAPYIHSDDRSLYFSSDGHVGMGRKDLFITRLQDDGSFSEPKNLGYPINTNYDEITLVVNAIGSKAYFSTDKFDTLSNANIYQFDLYKEVQPTKTTYLLANVRDAETKKKLEAQAKIYSFTKDQLIGQYKTNDGSFVAILPEQNEYAIHVEAKGYLFYSDNITIDTVSSLSKPYQVTIDLMPIAKGEKMKLENIYFETNKYMLEAKSHFELLELVNFMKKNADVKIEVKGYADNVGAKAYNLKLSQKRADEVAKFLIEKGVSSSRIQSKGYGSIDSSIEERAMQRRTEIEVL